MIDINLVFGESIALTTGTSAVVYNNKVLDLGAAGDTGSGDIYLFGFVNTAATGTSATLKIELQTSNSSSFSTYDSMIIKGPIAVGTLAKDYVIAKDKLPKGLKRYVRIMETPDSSNAFTAGAVSFMLCDSIGDKGSGF